VIIPEKFEVGKLNILLNQKIRITFRLLKKSHPRKIKPRIIFNKRTKKVQYLKKMGTTTFKSLKNKVLVVKI
jgi:hypothetical protein